jgi:hypothetical protein
VKNEEFLPETKKKIREAMDHFIMPDNLDVEFLSRGLQRLGISHVFKGSVQETYVDIKWRGKTVHLDFYIWERNPGLPVRPGDNGMRFRVTPGDIPWWVDDPKGESSVDGQAVPSGSPRISSIITRDKKAVWLYKGEYTEGEKIKIRYAQLAANFDVVYHFCKRFR